jgi:hypothetical protein
MLDAVDVGKEDVIRWPPMAVSVSGATRARASTVPCALRGKSSHIGPKWFDTSRFSGLGG